MAETVADFADLIGGELDDYIRRSAPLNVYTRVENASEHYTKAQKLDRLDDEMGVIRLIAAEEELVVAIFEALKAHDDQLPKHRDFVRKYKDHRVKQAFYPVLLNMRHVLEDSFRSGITFDGLEDVIHWHVRPVIDGDEIKIAIFDDKGKRLVATNALSTAISLDDKSPDEVADSLYRDMVSKIKSQKDMTLTEYMASRKDYRNKIFYADSDRRWVMEENLAELLPQYRQIFHDLLWTLALLLGNSIPSKSWGVVSQFIFVYRRVLVECEVLKEIEPGS